MTFYSLIWDSSDDLIEDANIVLELSIPLYGIWAANKLYHVPYDIPFYSLIWDFYPPCTIFGTLLYTFYSLIWD